MFMMIGFILTGCYDGLGRVWESSGLCTHILEGHSDVISSVCIVNPEGAASVTLATASKDRTLGLWKYSKDEQVGNPTKIRPFKILKGHRLSVLSVASQKSGDLICSGFWDCTINLWRMDEPHSEGDVSIKKRKKNNLAEESQLEFCGKALNCIDIGGEGSTHIAAGGSDPTIRIWDPRKPGTSGPIFKFLSHSSWVSSCKWHHKSWFHLLSASHDRKVMLWDLRTAWPLAVIDSHKDKVLCADWWKGDNVVSGGADSRLCISSGINVL